MMSEGMRLTVDQRKLVKARIRAAIAWHEEQSRLKAVDTRDSQFGDVAKRNLALVRGTYWQEVNLGDTYSINHILPALQTKHSIICGGDTEFLVKARQEAYQDVRETVSALLNNDWRALNLDDPHDMARWDAFIFPEGGLLEVGWRYEDDKHIIEGGRPDDTTLAEENIPQNAMPMMVAGNMIDPMTMMGATEYGDEDEAAQAVMTQPQERLEKPIVDEPFLERFEPTDFFWDPQCTNSNLLDARFVFRRKKATLADIKRNEKYSNVKKLKADYTGYYDQGKNDQQPERLSDNLQEEFGMVVLYDVYMYLQRKKGEKEELLHIVMAQQQDEELLAEPSPYEFGRASDPFPFIVIPGNAVDSDSFTSVPDVSLVRDLQVAHDEAWTQFEWQRAHTPNVLLVAAGIFDTEQGKETKRRIEEGNENAVLEVDQGMLPYVKWLDRPQPNDKIYQDLATTPEKIRQELGISDYQANILPAKGMTATEASTLQSQGGTRQENEIYLYNKTLSLTAYKLLALYQQFAVKPRNYSYTTPDGMQQYGEASMYDIRRFTTPPTIENPFGEMEEIGIQFALEVSPSKRVSMNRFMERKERIELLGTVGQFAQMQDEIGRPLVDMKALVNGIVDTFDFPDKTKIVPLNPTPQEIQQFQEMQAQQQTMMMDQRAAQESAGGEDKDMDRAIKLAELGIKAERGGNRNG